MSLIGRHRSKYGAHKVYWGDEKFDSKKELRRWNELVILQKAGEISNLRRQVKYQLVAPMKLSGMLRPGGIDYIADFVYTRNGAEIVEDVKGMKTNVYKIKRKLMMHFHGIDVQEV